MRASNDLVDLLEDLSDTDRANLKKSIEEIVEDGTHVHVGVATIKKVLGKTKDAAKKMVWELVVEIASETAKKALTNS